MFSSHSSLDLTVRASLTPVPSIHFPPFTLIHSVTWSICCLELFLHKTVVLYTPLSNTWKLVSPVAYSCHLVTASISDFLILVRVTIIELLIEDWLWASSWARPKRWRMKGGTHHIVWWTMNLQYKFWPSTWSVSVSSLVTDLTSELPPAASDVM